MIYIVLFLGIIGTSIEEDIVNFSPPTNKSLVKAPVTNVNCGCQCSSLTYQLNGAVQGNKHHLKQKQLLDPMKSKENVKKINQ